ncbi:kinase-like domain-containing protein [Desarmillaria tabescens]|uniref:Kinase-like domain-containing protein n=1 Tax=Armillaria tabescens TaxID=1929756 RepID=A0AA39NC61_ARMTA|nr:kinase-like domain-containing protein [Desarmillaria tabescens]KAK0462948.1 kinase-like domain-containing protein [Desarmillaria tabescens]
MDTNHVAEENTSTAGPSVDEESFASLPRTLMEWRIEGRICDPQDVSWPLIPSFATLFEKRGYQLWNYRMTSAAPPDETIPVCTHTYIGPYGWETEKRRFSFLQPYPNNITHPARTIHNQDVIIRLVAIEGDTSGDQHVQALERLSTGIRTYEASNPTLPVLNQLTFSGFHFIVFPYVYLAKHLPWFYNCGEILDFVMQLCKGVEYFHQLRVAHRDIALSNILCNFAGGRTSPEHTYNLHVYPFRSYFPIRYYFIDFEWAAVFDEDANLSDCTVIGLPEGRPPERYYRPKAPEMLLSAPYSPFPTDVFLLGTLLKDFLGPELNSYLELETKSKDSNETISRFVRELLSLFENMLADEAGDRPTAADTVITLKRIEEESRELHILEAYVGEDPRH